MEGTAISHRLLLSRAMSAAGFLEEAVCYLRYIISAGIPFELEWEYNCMNAAYE